MSKPKPIPQCDAIELPPTLAYRLHDNCYVSLTNRCTLRCAFCPKFNKTWDVQSYNLRLKREPGVDELLQAIDQHQDFHELVFCGLGEPTLRLTELIDIARAMKAQGASVRINTDGLANLVHGEDITPLLAGAIDSLSISLNAQNSRVYTRHCRPKLRGAYEAIPEFVSKAKRFVPAITLTAIEGLAGVDIKACAAMAKDLGAGFRKRQLDVVG